MLQDFRWIGWEERSVKRNLTGRAKSQGEKAKKLGAACKQLGSRGVETGGMVKDMGVTGGPQGTSQDLIL